MVVSMFPVLMMIAGWCFFDKTGLGAVALALAIISLLRATPHDDTK